MPKNTNYLHRYDKLLTKLAEKHGIKKEELILIIDHFFLTMKGFITDWRMPTIKITNVGTFKPKIGKINFVLKTSYRYFRKGYITAEKISSKIKEVWPVKQRLIKESLGIETWRDWRNKEKDAKTED